MDISSRPHLISSILLKTDSDFQQDVLDGLSANPKILSSKYFYDKRGSELFQDIMRMPEYYPTDVEYEIFQTHKHSLLEIFSPNGRPFRLVEFGAGDGLKTKVLLSHFLNEHADFTYMPIDISKDVLDLLYDDLKSQFPNLSVQPIVNDYFKAMKKVNKLDDTPKAVLFLGSNIGNFIENEAISFLRRLRTLLSPSDILLTGFDLKKDPKIILDAYDDPSGVTKAFNLNLLNRINRELGGNFDLDAFDHYANYDPISGETKSYIFSKVDQSVFIGALNRGFHFQAWEPIWTELSQKYSIETIQRLAREADFSVATHFFDEKRYFADSAWIPNE